MPDREVVSQAIPGDKAYLAPVRGSSNLVWHNTGPFLRAWKLMLSQGEYKKYGWSVKVDPDAVFSPQKLRMRLQTRVDAGMGPEDEVYVINCAQWGSLQGPLEVYSAAGATKFYTSLDQCTGSLNWQSWGEDWFMSRCMDMIGVKRETGYDFLKDKWCDDQMPTCSEDMVAFHPFKTQDSYMQCVRTAGFQ